MVSRHLFTIAILVVLAPVVLAIIRPITVAAITVCVQVTLHVFGVWERFARTHYTHTQIHTYIYIHT